MNSAATTTPTASTETPQVGISLRNLYKIFLLDRKLAHEVDLEYSRG